MALAEAFYEISADSVVSGARLANRWARPIPFALYGARRRNMKTSLTTHDPAVLVVPANEASWDDLNAVIGKVRCHAAQCYCQRFKIAHSEWRWISDEERARRLREQTQCGNPRARTTTGLVAYIDGEPVGWCSVEPRTAYVYLMKTRMPWAGRYEDKANDRIWAVGCFVTRTGFRLRGITYALAHAAVDFARARGADALEGYAMITQPGKEITWGELHVGSVRVYEAAGFEEVSRPSKRRVVMRIEF
jgi:GNAT superfamily N-acetyltransferase